MDMSAEKTEAVLRVKYVPNLRVARFRATGPYGLSSAKAWKALFAWLDDGAHKIPHRGFGLAYDDPRQVPAEALRFDACIEVPDSWQERDSEYAVIQTLRGGPHAGHTFVGSYSKLGNILSELRDRHIPRQGLSIDVMRPILFIHYDDPRNTADSAQRTEVCVPVRIS